MSHNTASGTPTWTTADATSEAEWIKWINEQTQAAQQPQPVRFRRPAAVRVDPIEAATDDVLILELVKRGFAVGKLDGQKVD